MIEEFPSTDRKNKIYVQYRNNIYPYWPIEHRIYTITHSDISADIFVHIGTEYAEDKIIALRDEVRVVWDKFDGDLALVGEVVIDNDDIQGNTELRNKIFITEIHKAIEALRYGDRFLFDAYPELDGKHIYIHFISNDPRYDQVYDYGVIGMYQL